MRTTRYNSVQQLVHECWIASPALMATAAIMCIVLVANLIGLVVDDRIITGMPAWLKPAKFSSSVIIYTTTLAWMFRFIPERSRLRQRAGGIIAAMLCLEIVVIDLQAWRGTTSHFNYTSVLNGVLFGIMGLSILVLWVASIIVMVAFFRTTFADPALGWLVRFGALIMVVGAGLGAAMTRPTTEQLAQLERGVAVKTVGAHTVGAPDGGPGIPGFGWSTRHGDWRVAHFVGLHALQLLPLLYLLIGRVRNVRRRARLAIVAGVSYSVLVGILAWQALRGQSVVTPDSLTFSVLGIWGVATLVAAIGTQSAAVLRIPRRIYGDSRRYSTVYRA